MSNPQTLYSDIKKMLEFEKSLYILCKDSKQCKSCGAYGINEKCLYCGSKL